MSRRYRLRRRVHHARLGHVAFASIGALLVSLLLVAAAGATVVYSYVDRSLQGLPDVDDPALFRLAVPTKVYSADNKLLADFHVENREIVPLSRISTDLVDALVAVEDERYYQHTGVDLVGIARAVVIDVATGSTREGASTITQQYIRNTILIDERYDISLRRKIREGWLATQLEKRHTKAQILEKYLNTVYFGDGAYGAQAAAKTYFGKPADKLTLAEAALLAGLPQSPQRLNPHYNLPGARARQRWALDRMVATGYITKEQAAQALAEKLALKKTVDPAQGIYDCGYFVSYVRKQLLAKYRDEVVFKGGLTVYTTIDTRLQRAAERAVKKTLPGRRDPEAALVSIDPRNGYIKAMYGGRNYMANRYNTATQGRRQAGSAFKVFVLVTALEAGISPDQTFDSSSPAVIPTDPPWKVSNSEGTGHGYITLSDATRNSVNAVFARLIMRVGPARVARTAHRMGIESRVPAYPSIALGTAPVSPLEMAEAYGTLATGGIHNDTTAITRILDADGNEIYKHEVDGARVLTPQIAWAATQQLMGVVTGGTGTRAALGRREIAGKTGTAQNYQDAWFCGYTPQMCTVVWMGYLRGAIPMRNVHGRRAFGGTFCAPIWHDYMAVALRSAPFLRFTRAASPTYVADAGASSGSYSSSSGGSTKKTKTKATAKPSGSSAPPPSTGGNTGGGGGTPPPPGGGGGGGGGTPPPPDPGGGGGGSTPGTGTP